jgi:hypothetical protein
MREFNRHAHPGGVTYNSVYGRELILHILYNELPLTSPPQTTIFYAGFLTSTRIPGGVTEPTRVAMEDLMDMVSLSVYITSLIPPLPDLPARSGLTGATRWLVG